MAAYEPKGVPQPYVQQGVVPMTNVVTTTTRDPEMDSAQVQRTTSVSTAIAVFAGLGLLMGLTIFLLNVVPIGSGVEIWSDVLVNYRINYYPGLWYGLLNVAACAGTLAFCYKAITNSKTDAGYIISDGCIRTTGALLSTAFGILAAVGIGAVVTGAVTTVVLDHSLDVVTCTYDAVSETCLCSGSYYVKGVESCDYAWGTLFQVYRTITAISGFLAIFDIVIASLFCGVLCCCIVTPAYQQMGNQVIVTSMPQQQMFVQPGQQPQYAQQHQPYAPQQQPYAQPPPQYT